MGSSCPHLFPALVARGEGRNRQVARWHCCNTGLVLGLFKPHKMWSVLGTMLHSGFLLVV